MIFLIITVAMLITLFLLRRHQPIGIAILAGGLFIWLCTDPKFDELTGAAVQMFTSPRSYDLVGALYLVICLEIELRTGAWRGWLKRSRACSQAAVLRLP